MKKIKNSIQKLQKQNIALKKDKTVQVKGGSKRIYVGNLPFGG